MRTFYSSPLSFYTIYCFLIFVCSISYSLYAVFLFYLMAFDCQELKGLLTYLLTARSNDGAGVR